MSKDELNSSGEAFARPMTIIDGLCWKCGQAMKVAVSESDDGISQFCGPDEFTQEELQFARSMGVVIEPQDSKTAGFSYLANTCQHCRAFVGGFYLFTQYIQPADVGEFESAIYDVVSPSKDENDL